MVDACNFRRNACEPVLLKQLKLATLVVLNKCSEVEPGDLERIRGEVASHNPEARILPADFCNVEIAQILQSRFFADQPKLDLLSKHLPVGCGSNRQSTPGSTSRTKNSAILNWRLLPKSTPTNWKRIWAN